MGDKSVTFGNYELLRKIAQGGMAEIFLARERGIEGIERKVVVKRILPHLTDNDEFVTMFIDEAKVFEKRWLEWDGEPNQITTLDKRYIHIDIFARWRISDVRTFIEVLRDEDTAPLSVAERAMMRFARKVAIDSSSITAMSVRLWTSFA